MPDTAEYGDSVTASLTVENIGDTDGTFVGALNRIGPSVAYAPETNISLETEAGEDATWTYSHTPTNDTGDEEPNTMWFGLNWRDDRLTAKTSIQPRNS